MTIEKVTSGRRIRVALRTDCGIRDGQRIEPNGLAIRCRAIPSANVAGPEGSIDHPHLVRIMRHGERDPVARHYFSQSLVIGAWPAGRVRAEESFRRAVDFGAGGEGEFEDGGAVGVAVDGVGRHVVLRSQAELVNSPYVMAVTLDRIRTGWACDDPVAEPRLALEESAVEVGDGIEIIQAGEEGWACEWEKILGVNGFGRLGREGEVAEDVALVRIVVDD